MAAFALNTRLFLNALEGVSDDEAVRRPNDRINSMSFIAAHLVDVRHYTLAYLGASSHNPLATLLRDVGSIDDVRALPDIEKLRSYWRITGMRRCRTGEPYVTKAPDGGE